MSGEPSRAIRGGNLYCNAQNGPLGRFDPPGLTDKDVQTIIDTFLNTMKTMCQDGRCCPRGSTWFDWMQNYESYFSNREGCAQQAEDLYVAMYPLTNGKLDDDWLAEPVAISIRQIVPPHNYVTMIPRTPQPQDPDGYSVDNIAVDTWKGCYTITKRKMVFIETNPQQSFWLWKDEKRCFTCKDLKGRIPN